MNKQLVEDLIDFPDVLPVFYCSRSDYDEVLAFLAEHDIDNFESEYVAGLGEYRFVREGYEL